jgi:hypothetical protein
VASETEIAANGNETIEETADPEDAEANKPGTPTE